MERYFEKFSSISYANTIAKNITQRTTFVNSVYNNPLFYYPYDIAQSERPDGIAGRYYGDEYMSWLLYLSNKVIDPYYDWYMDQATLQDFITKKYESLAKAMTRTKFYRNNWYSDQTPTISASAYSILSPNHTKYYEPVPINGEIVNNPTEYTRRKEDWTVTTNQIVSYAVANGSSFETDEIVDVVFNANQKGTGQVTFANTTTTILQHMAGVVTTGTIGSSYLYGRDSKTNTAFTAVNSSILSIPANEASFWSPVTYYDYEDELNEQNKSILVLKNEYSSTVSKQLKQLLR
jgi:hypothetical protein